MFLLTDYLTTKLTGRERTFNHIDNGHPEPAKQAYPYLGDYPLIKFDVN